MKIHCETHFFCSVVNNKNHTSARVEHWHNNDSVWKLRMFNLTLHGDVNKISTSILRRLGPSFPLCVKEIQLLGNYFLFVILFSPIQKADSLKGCRSPDMSWTVTLPGNIALYFPLLLFTLHRNRALTMPTALMVRGVDLIFMNNLSRCCLR
jgi:hypothetical protein